MEGYSSSHESSDEATSANTALLSECHRPENVARNRILCRENGIPDGAQELRRLQHFVSQAIIKLLTKHNITQKDGRPYVASCPKGFLQGPNVWLMDKGFYMSGWPLSGLPTGSISIWPAYFTFALAVMFIRGTITLKPLPLGSGQQQRQGDAPSARKPLVRRAKKSLKATGPLNRDSEIASKETAEVNKNSDPRVRSDAYAGLKQIDRHSALASKLILKESNIASTSNGGDSRVKESEEQPRPAASERVTLHPDSSRPSAAVSSFSGTQRSSSASTVHLSYVKSGSSAMRDTHSTHRLSGKSAIADAGRGGENSNSSLFPVPVVVGLDDFSGSNTLKAYGLPFSPDMNTGVVHSSTGTDYRPDTWGKRRASALEVSYPGVPANATIDWVPPTSAARDTKRFRWV